MVQDALDDLLYDVAHTVAEEEPLPWLRHLPERTLIAAEVIALLELSIAGGYPATFSPENQAGAVPLTTASKSCSANF